MTLRITLAGLLVLALACSGGSETADAPPPPPPPAADGAGGTGGEATPPPGPSLAEQAMKDIEGEEAAAEAVDETVEYKTKEMSTTVKLPPAQRKDLAKTGRRLLDAEAQKAGYDEITKFKLGKPNCDGEWCTATVTGTARKAVKKTVEEGVEGEATEATEGEATEAVK